MSSRTCCLKKLRIKAVNPRSTPAYPELGWIHHGQCTAAYPELIMIKWFALCLDHDAFLKVSTYPKVMTFIRKKHTESTRVKQEMNNSTNDITDNSTMAIICYQSHCNKIGHKRRLQYSHNLQQKEASNTIMTHYKDHGFITIINHWIDELK